jgi:transposase
LTTFAATLRCKGITAPFVIDKAMTGDIFRAYVKQCLVPILSAGDIVVRDSLPAHKVAGIRE